MKPSQCGLMVFAALLMGGPAATATADGGCVAAWSQAAASFSCATLVLPAETHLPGHMVNNCAVKANGGTLDSTSC